jgi:hypothetical protein
MIPYQLSHSTTGVLTTHLGRVFAFFPLAAAAPTLLSTPPVEIGKALVSGVIVGFLSSPQLWTMAGTPDFCLAISLRLLSFFLFCFSPASGRDFTLPTPSSQGGRSGGKGEGVGDRTDEVGKS